MNEEEVAPFLEAGRFPGGPPRRRDAVDGSAEGGTSRWRVDGSADAEDASTPSSTALDRVRAIVASVAPSAEDANATTDVRSLEGWDSLAALRVIVSLEKELGITLPHDLFAAPRTLASLAALASTR